MHTSEVKLKGQQEKIEKVKEAFMESEAKESPGDVQTSLDEGRTSDLSFGGHDQQGDHEEKVNNDKDEEMEDQGIDTASTVEEKTVNPEHLHIDNGDISHPGALWDVFRRQDVPKLMEYLQVHWEEFGKATSATDSVCFSNFSYYKSILFLIQRH